MKTRRFAFQAVGVIRASRKLRADTAEMRLIAQDQQESARDMVERARWLVPPRRRVLVFMEDAIRLEQACRLLRAQDWDVVACSDLAATLAELDSNRRIDALVVDEEATPLDRRRGSVQ